MKRWDYKHSTKYDKIDFGYFWMYYVDMSLDSLAGFLSFGVRVLNVLSHLKSQQNTLKFASVHR